MTINQVCLEANRLAQAEDVTGLGELHKYVHLNKKSYALVEVDWMFEYIESLVRGIVKREVKQLVNEVFGDDLFPFLRIFIQ